jgi:hypothetical protein
MIYFIDIDIPLDVDKFIRQYNEHFAWKLDDPDIRNQDKRIHLSSGQFLIRAGDPGPNGELLDWGQDIVNDALGIDMDQTRIFVTNAHESLPIHRDALNGEPRGGALNVPLLNCELGKNEWFLDKDNDFSNEINYYGRSIHPIPGKNPWKPAASTILNRTKLFRSDLYHNMNNEDNPNRRVILSYRTSTPVTWDELCKRAENYINRNK